VGQPGRIAVLVASIVLLLFSHPLIHGDGNAYFMYLDSIAGDGDLDLTNQTERFARANIYHYFESPHTGEPVTSFAFGSAYLLAPFYWLAQALEPHVPALRARPDYFALRQGLPLAYSLAVMLGAHLYTLAAVWLSYRVACRVAARWAAALAAVACLLGTPLLFYATVEPMASHAYGAFVLALALWLATPGSSEAANTGPVLLNVRRALAVGLLLGMAMLVRWQLLLFAVPAGGALLWSVTVPGQRVRALAATGAFALGVGLFASLCSLYFWRYFGSPLAIPNESQIEQAFLTTPLRYLPHVLFDVHNGWLVWSPVAAVGLAGLAWAAWSARGIWRVVAAVCLAGIVLQLVLNGSIADWYAGWAFGMRRMTEAYSALVLGTAWLLSHSRWPRLSSSIVILCGCYGLLLFVAYLYYTRTSPYPEGGTVFAVIGWLLTHGQHPPLWLILRERFGPWAWAYPRL
jgi:hypothetical protein